LKLGSENQLNGLIIFQSFFVVFLW